MKLLHVLAKTALLALATSSTLVSQAVANPTSGSSRSTPKMFPPFPSEFSKPGEGKFVIFTREETGKEWDFVAGVWECIPSRPNTPVTKRGEFCHSWWNATPLLDVLVSDDSCGLHPRFTRLQVNSGDRDYTVHLYDINYRTWEAKCIWQGNRLSAFGVLGDSIFCRNTDEWLLLDATSGKISTEVPFTPFKAEGDFWLVRKPGESGRYWSYDPKARKYIAHFKQVDPPFHGLGWPILSKDGVNRAWLLAPITTAWRGGQLPGELILQRHGVSEDISVPVEILATRGSGRPVIPKGVQFMFSPDGTLQLHASIHNSETETRVWSIDITTGKVDIQTAPRREPSRDAALTLDGVAVPDYLKDEFQSLRNFGRSGLAPAFLMHMGILQAKPSYPDGTAAVSRDGRHVLYRAKKGSLAGVFIYGDLLTKQVVKWDSPTGLSPLAVMDFAWVETPQ